MLTYTISCPSVYEELIDIINDSFSKHEFPNLFKTSIVHPIPKTKNPSDVKQFRPISIQCNLSKNFEKLVHEQLYEYLHQNNIIYGGQFGFRKGHSTSHALVAITDFIYSDLNTGKFGIIVTLDLSKAFDKVVKEILIEKLAWYGIDNRWFKSYLEKRLQKVKLGNKTSSTQNTLLGVPQGSILGPLLFI